MPSKIADIEEVCLVEAGYAYLMTSMNRAIPVAISVYRYCLVFHPYFFMTPKPKKILGILLFFYIMGNKLNTYVFLVIVVKFANNRGYPTLVTKYSIL